MPTSSDVYPHGKIRFFRLAAILHEEGKELLTLFFLTFYVGKALDAYLNEQAIKDVIDKAYKKQVIYRDQYALLYPNGIAKSDVRLFDITLLVFLIRSLHPALNINASVWKHPSAQDTSVEACVTKLKDARNKLWGHIYELEISETDFEVQCLHLQDLFETMANGIKDPSYPASCVADRIRKRRLASLDPDAENRILIILQSWKRHDNQGPLLQWVEEIVGKVDQIREVVCSSKETRSVATSTAEDVIGESKRTSTSSTSSSLSSNGTVYEQPVSKETQKLLNDNKENTQNDMIKCGYNDAATSTSSLEASRKLSNIFWSFIMPFIGSIRPHGELYGPLLHHPLKQNSANKTQNRRRPSTLSWLPCTKRRRRFRHSSTFDTCQHDDLPLKCFISGLVQLLNGLRVIIDSSHKYIQVYDQSCVLIDQYKCWYPIKNVCAFKGDKIAVTLYAHRSVALFEVTRKDGVRYLETIDVNCEGWLKDVKYSGGKLYTLCDKSEIHIHHFRSIPDDVIKFDIGVVPISFDISVSNCRMYLYIAHSDGVLCFSESGTEIWEYKQYRRGENLELTQIHRYNDKLFVSAWGTNRIIELTTDGRWLRDIGVGQTLQPWAVDVSLTGEKLFVSQYSTTKPATCCREVLVFD